MAEQDIREQMVDLYIEYRDLDRHAITKIYPSQIESVRRFFDQILNIKCSRGGGVCPRCGSKGTWVLGFPYSTTDTDKPCPTCNGTGSLVETKEIKEIIKEWESDNK